MDIETGSSDPNPQIELENGIKLTEEAGVYVAAHIAEQMMMQTTKHRAHDDDDLDRQEQSFFKENFNEQEFRE